MTKWSAQEVISDPGVYETHTLTCPTPTRMMAADSPDRQSVSRAAPCPKARLPVLLADSSGILIDLTSFRRAPESATSHGQTIVCAKKRPKRPKHHIAYRWDRSRDQTLCTRKVRECQQIPPFSGESDRIVPCSFLSERELTRTELSKECTGNSQQESLCEVIPRGLEPSLPGDCEAHQRH